jgi:hypothetical protein
MTQSMVALGLLTLSVGCAADPIDVGPEDEGKSDGAGRSEFRLRPKREVLADCEASDRDCYLRTLDLSNAFWLGAVSKTIYETRVDAARPGLAFAGMTSDEVGLILPDRVGGLAEAGLAWREFVIFDDSLARATASYFETTDGVAVLTFRGTTNPEGPANLATDLNVAKACAVSGGEEYCIHSGFRDSFYHLWSSGDWARYAPMTFCADGVDEACAAVPASDKVVVRVEMRKYLAERFSGPNAPHALFITGHSLGGALATLALNELLLDSVPLGNVDMAVYTYGTPRVGNQAFATKVFEESRARDIPYYRFVHRQDGVARVRWPGYAHVGTNPDGELDGLDTFVHLVGPDERDGEGEIMSLGQLDEEDPGDSTDMLRDHDMTKYMPVLELAELPE